MPRALHDHKINPMNEQSVSVLVRDEPDPNAGNACHNYSIVIRTTTPDVAAEPENLVRSVDLKFQHGPIAEAGVNGITDQALLAIVLDRWRSFQTSKWSNRETAMAITKLEEALMWQHKRTLDRIRRDVEGTNQV